MTVIDLGELRHDAPPPAAPPPAAQRRPAGPHPGAPAAGAAHAHRRRAAARTGGVDAARRPGLGRVRLRRRGVRGAAEPR
ncbi:hypothetical protein MCBG_02349 [Micromonospora sp. M42]|nr:hypothetical protein MCBG_02349 [Micromonospora sp. M42]